MKNLFKGNGNWREVCVGVHYICHKGPPFFYDRIFPEILRSTIALNFLNGKENVGFLIKKDGIVRYAAFFKKLSQFGPERVMSSFVFLFEARLQLHFKCDNLLLTHLSF